MVLLMVYAFLLFFILTPGILVVLPKGGSKMTVALVHAAIFAIVWTLLYRYLTTMTESHNIHCRHPCPRNQYCNQGVCMYGNTE